MNSFVVYIVFIVFKGTSRGRTGPIKKGGVCIVVREDPSFDKIDTSLHCSEWTLEVCAVELESKSSNLRIFSVYRAPSANFTLKYL
jgi:hypothetical protein